jgi:threonine synthase
MACRRCNKLKQPCDHAYPACSLCAKYGERCRYRDDLTGRQIRPGQLEEVEVALYDAQNEIKRLQEKLKKLEEAHNPRDDAQD